MRISDWSSDVCSSDLSAFPPPSGLGATPVRGTREAWPRPAPQRRGNHATALALKPRAMMQGAHMKLSSRSLPASGRIPGRCAFAVQAPFGHVRLGHNRNPQLTWRSEEHTSELQSLMRISYAVFCWKKKKTKQQTKH